MADIARVDAELHRQIVTEQRSLWGTAPRDWSELAERENLPLYEAILAAGAVAERTRMLDVGCGSGLLCELASERGAEVCGVDVCAELLQIARERVGAGAFVDGDMSRLPYPDREFDLVTGVNSFQFAPDPILALAESRRVLRPAGRLIAAVFAEPERNEGTALHLAMKGLIVQAEGEQDGYAPYALSTETGLVAALTDAGLAPIQAVEVPVAWRYSSVETTLRALLASAGGARAVRAVGRERVIAALIPAIGQFKREDGVVIMHNLFRYVIAEKGR